MIIRNKFNGYSADGIRLYHKSGGGGGYNAPPPDPALVAAQIKSMGVQDLVMEELLANSKENAPLLKEQTQFGINAQRTAFDQSQQDRDWMLTRRDKLSGVQDQLVADAEEFNQGERQDQLARDAMADVTAGFDSAQSQADRALAARGVRADSGAALALRNQNTVQKGVALAGAANAARQGAKAEGRALVDRANNALAGYPSMGMGATGAGAGFGANAVNVANAGTAGQNASLTAASGVAGQMGQNATSMHSAQGNYQTNMMGLQQKAQQSDNQLMSSLGSAAGMMMMFSDRKMKTKVRGLRRGEARDIVDATPVKEWQYKDDSPAADGGARHVGPMAQDLQRTAGDDVAPDGKMIDVISANGINMAAIQDVSSDLKQLEHKVDRVLNKRGGIKRKESSDE